MLCNRCLELARSILQLSDRDSKTWNTWERCGWIQMRDDRWKLLYANSSQDLRTSDTHNHILAPNRFIYKVHTKVTPQYRQAASLALGHRLAHQSYSSMRMVLNSSGLRIDRTTYYNLVRGAPLSPAWPRHVSRNS